MGTFQLIYTQELRELVRQLCTEREVLMHFMMYETYRKMIQEK